jgi:hypothetical protein
LPIANFRIFGIQPFRDELNDCEMAIGNWQSAIGNRYL